MSPNTNDTTLITTTESSVTTTDNAALAHVGQVANGHAQRGVFADYVSRKADNTLKRQSSDLLRFADYLRSIGAAAGVELHSGVETFAKAIVTYTSKDESDREPLQGDVWRGVTWGLVEGFRNWMVAQGDAVGSINVRLSTVKTYCKLATKAGMIDAKEHAMIRLVAGYAHKEAKRVNERRDVTRRGDKKAQHTSITDKQARKLKQQPDTPQGRRDAVLMCLLLDHGLRCGEVAILKVSDFDLKAGEMTFYRPKVDRVQTHKLSADTLRALQAYFDSGDAPAAGPLLRNSRKGGQLTTAGMNERAITKRVRALGIDAGLYVEQRHVTDGGTEKVKRHGTLSAHDCRHFWATHWARKVDVIRLQEAGGWASMAMPRRYIEAAEIANEGMA